jgi:hypothetical protein
VPIELLKQLIDNQMFIIYKPPIPYWCNGVHFELISFHAIMCCFSSLFLWGMLAYLLLNDAISSQILRYIPRDHDAGPIKLYQGAAEKMRTILWWEIVNQGGELTEFRTLH